MEEENIEDMFILGVAGVVLESIRMGSLWLVTSRHVKHYLGWEGTCRHVVVCIFHYKTDCIVWMIKGMLPLTMQTMLRG